jgi:thiol-disulfide isomerase/thioredoxin
MEPTARDNRTWLWLALGLLIAWVSYLRFFGPNAEKSSVRPAVAVTDYRWVLEDLDGAPLDLGRYRGKTVFLNVWATWCGPCVAEMPSISRLASNPRIKDVVFVCVSLDDNLEVVRQFVQGKNFQMTVLHSAGTVPDAFDTDAIPATFIIAPDGHIVLKEVGSNEWDKSEVAERLERLSHAPAGGSSS